MHVVHAPRHLERVEGLAAQVSQKLGLAPARRSKGESDRYLLLDTYGELANVYAAADVVVIGGGFENLGGQNLIQPLALGRPVVHGPHMQNFRSSAAAAGGAGATFVAASAAELASALDRLFSDPDLRKKMGTAAAELVRQNLGASQRYAKAIAEAVLAQPSR